MLHSDLCFLVLHILTSSQRIALGGFYEFRFLFPDICFVSYMPNLELTKSGKRSSGRSTTYSMAFDDWRSQTKNVSTYHERLGTVQAAWPI